MISMESSEYLKSKFKRYYLGITSDRLSYPALFQREFGTSNKLEKKISRRHQTFNNAAALLDYLQNEIPYFVSVSSAKYKFPDKQPMDTKERTTTDLIFDFDKEVGHACPEPHCLECIAVAKYQTQLLIEEFLYKDFGITEKELMISFSGSHGYHVRVFHSEYEKYDGDMRKSLITYLKGTEFDAWRHIDVEASQTQNPRILGPAPSRPAWIGRMARCIKEQVQDPFQAIILSPEFNKPEVRDRFLAGLEYGNWSGFPVKNFDSLKQKMDKYGAVVADRFGISCDGQCTMDLSRLLRMPNTIHGGSGLLAKSMSFSDLEQFDPYKDSVVFSMAERVPVRMLEDVPSTGFYGETTESYKKDSIVELPEAYAIYLIAKKKGGLA